MPKKTRASSFENIFVSETHRAIYNEISYLKKRIHLVEGERKANYESNEETIKKNDTRVKELKENHVKLKNKHKTAQESRDNFFKQISIKFGGEKKAYEFKGKNYADAMDILECKIGTSRNKSNALRYKKGQQDEKLAKVMQKEDNLQNLMEEKEDEPHERFNCVRKRKEETKGAETATAAMQMKIIEADNIRCRYRNMIGILQAENLSLNAKVADEDHKMILDLTEIEKTKKILQDSLRAKKLAKSRLSEIETRTIKEYSDREQQLYQSRLQLKQIHEKMEQIGSKLSFPKFHMIHRDSSVTDGLYAGYRPNLDEGEMKPETIIETVYTQLSGLIGETDPALIVTRFIEQREHAKELLKEEDKDKSTVRKSKLRKRFLLDKLRQLQFSGGLRRETLNEKLSKITEEIQNILSSQERLDKFLHDHFQAMDQMQTKLIEICKNNDLKYPPPTEVTVTGQNVIGLLKFVLRQMERLLVSQDGPLYSPLVLSGAEDSSGNLAPEGMMFGVLSPAGSARLGGSVSDFEGLDGDKFQWELDDLLGSRDRAPSIAVPEGTLISPGGGAEEVKREDSGKKSGLRRGDSSEEEEAVSRNLVKRQSQILYEAKTRKGRFNAGMATNVRTRKF